LIGEVVLVKLDVHTDSIAQQVSFVTLHRASVYQQLTRIVHVEDGGHISHDLRRILRLVVGRGVNGLTAELLEQTTTWPHVGRRCRPTAAKKGL
jgi:hypothetical protein